MDDGDSQSSFTCLEGKMSGEVCAFQRLLENTTHFPSFLCNYSVMKLGLTGGTAVKSPLTLHYLRPLDKALSPASYLSETAE